MLFRCTIFIWFVLISSISWLGLPNFAETFYFLFFICFKCAHTGSLKHLVTALKFLSDNSNTYVSSILESVNCFFYNSAWYVPNYYYEVIFIKSWIIWCYVVKFWFWLVFCFSRPLLTLFHWVEMYIQFRWRDSYLFARSRLTVTITQFGIYEVKRKPQIVTTILANPFF